MPSIKVDISPNILNWVLKNAFLEGLDNNVSNYFSQWKNNEKQPTFAQIEEISRKTHIPLGYFFLQTPPVEQVPLIEYRTLKSAGNVTPSRELLETYNHMTDIQDWMRDYLVDSGMERLEYVGSCKNENDIEKIAVSIRNIISLEVDWFLNSKDTETSFKTLREYFENAGILIIKNGIVGQNTHRPLDVNEFRAFTLIDDYAPLVFINNKDREGGQLFSLMHEIVHIWIGVQSFYNDSYGMHFNISPLETLCNAVAAELLVPNAYFKEQWKNDNNPELDSKIRTIAKYFKCGRMVVARRALDNQYISNDEYQDITKKLIAFFNRNNQNRKTGGKYYDTAISRYGTRLLLALTRSVYEGKTLLKDAYKLTCTKSDTFEKLVNEVMERTSAN